MSVAGLRRKPHFEEVLNAAVKDESSQHGILSVPMQRAASAVINNPLFQRVQATLTSALELEQKQVLEQRDFENNVQRIAVDARVSHEDLKWLVENLQQPPPPPPMPPPPPSEARVDYERMAAEVDGLLQKRAVEHSHKALAEEVERRLAAQAVATPAQQIIQEHHHHFIVQPTPLPVPPVPTSVTAQARHTGLSVHELFLAAQTPQAAAQPASSSTDIPMQYFAPPTKSAGYPGKLAITPVHPAPVPRHAEGGEIPAQLQRPQVRKVGKLKQKFETSTAKPPKVIGATGPMVAPPGGFPIPPNLAPSATRGPPAPPSQPGVPAGPPPFLPVRRAKPRALPYSRPGDDGDGLSPISGVMHLRGSSNFSHAAVEAAKQRMIEIARRAVQQTTRKQNFDKRVEVEKKKRRAERRGGGYGDVVALGKRKAPEPDLPLTMLRKAAPPEPRRARQRIYGPATQVFSMAD